MTVTDTRLPSAFAEFEPFAEKWCLATEPERWEARLATPMQEIHEFYDAFSPRFEEAIDYCDKFPLDDVPDDALQPAAPHLLDDHGVDGRRGLRHSEARRLRRRRHRPRQRAGAVTPPAKDP